MSPSAPFTQRLLTLLLLPLLIFGGIPVEVDCCCDVRSSRATEETEAVVDSSAVEVGTRKVSSCCAKNAARQAKSNSEPLDPSTSAHCKDCRCRLVISRRNEQPLSLEKAEAMVPFAFTAEIARCELPWRNERLLDGLCCQPEDRAHPPPRFLLFGNLRC